MWDLDNHCKAVMDALTGIAYTDDKLVRELVARIDRIPKGAAEGFLYDVQPYTVQETPEPHFEPYTLPLPAEKAAAEDNDVRRRI
ncbi:hypothetical protein FACS189419_04850 [Planctomycetales bacterium]|nr:hypothetical protein FACS189419_04850 [Planctomycetales bacterium]